MLAELLCPRIWIVIRPIPVESLVLFDHFIRSVAGYSDRADIAESSQSVVITSRLSGLDYFERPFQIDVQAYLFALPIERCRAVDDRFGRFDQHAIIIRRQAESTLGQISAKDADAALQMPVKDREIHVKLEGSPQSHLGLALVPRADQQIELIGMSFQQ